MMLEPCTGYIFLDVATVLFCLLTYIIDVIVSGFLVAKYLKNSNEFIAILAAALLVLPGIITSILGGCWIHKDSPYRKMLPMSFHVFRILSIIFLVSPLYG